MAGRKRINVALLAATAGMLSGTVGACGSNGSRFDDNTDRGVGDDVGGDDAEFSATDGLAVGDSGLSLDAACATSSAEAKLAPAYLVMMFDRSCSMTDADKWTNCKAGLTAFLADAKTSGVSASLQYFPQPPAGSSSGASCTGADYKAPLVAMTSLPSGVFATPIEDEQISCGTPTYPALEGAYLYAHDIQTAHPGAPVAVVLITDGDPDSCGPSPNWTDDVTTLIGKNAGTVKTYVIGVGQELTNLNSFAAAGGTGTATLVSTSSAQTVQDFEAALGSVKADAVPCDYAIPPNPQGQAIDPTRVNVLYTSGAATPSTLDYDANCAAGTGWEYDDPSHPTKIILCPATCSTIKGDGSARVDVLFGCQVHGDIR